MQEWPHDNALFELIKKELYTAVIGDICDVHGLRKQFLSPSIRPLSQEKKVPIMAGRAMTVLEVDVHEEPQKGSPFGKMLEALDNLKKNEIYLCTGASRSYATIGELMCTAMIARGACGAVSDSYIRDVEGIRELNFPLYSLGPYAQDQRGRGVVKDFRVPIEINGVSIHDGDLVVGDIDGVLVLPAAQEVELIQAALVKARGEKKVKKAIEKGMLCEDAFAQYGIM